MVVAFTCARLVLEFCADAVEKLIQASIVRVGSARQSTVGIVHRHDEVMLVSSPSPSSSSSSSTLGKKEEREKKEASRLPVGINTICDQPDDSACLEAIPRPSTIHYEARDDESMFKVRERASN
jgi:hypothetical protein